MLLQQLHEETYRGYVKRLVKELGIKRLGQGSFASVFQHPTHADVVVKVFPQDDAYERYLRWAMNHQSNKYVPKIIDFVKSPIEAEVYDDVRIVFMRKMKRISTTEGKKFFKYIRSLLPEDNVEIVRHDLRDLCDEHWEDLATQQKDKDLAEFARYIWEGFDANDLHYDNIMKDETGNLVFVDPVS